MNDHRFLVVAICFLVSSSVVAEGVRVEAPRYVQGGTWSVVELEDRASLPQLAENWQRSTFWDLRPFADRGRLVRWSVERPQDAGLSPLAESRGADLALCARAVADNSALGCKLIVSTEAGPTGPSIVWSDQNGEADSGLRVGRQLDGGTMLVAGDRYTDKLLDDEDVVVGSIAGVALAEGVALTPAGPAQVVLVRETLSDGDGSRTVVRFIEDNGRTVASFDMKGGEPTRGWVLAEADRLADDGLEIEYSKLSQSLTAGSIGFLQYAMDFSGVNCLFDADCGLPNALCVGSMPTATPPETGSCRVPLADLRAGWTGIGDVIGIDQTSVSYQPDPDDPTTQQTLPEVWEFATLNTGILQQRTFNSIRDDTGWSTCLETCAVKDQSPSPPDGTWQAYLKIDNYDASGSFVTRDVFTFNDNDTGADPSIDVPFVVQDQENVSDRNQICFDDSGGDPAERLLEFFQFTGADPASATLGVGDAWASGNWTSCNNSSGLFLTIASACGDNCYPTCDGPAAPRARGLLGGGAGLGGTIVEDGYLHVAAGNYVPALLLLQETDLEAGADFIASCVLATTRLRGIDYFWVNERYGLLALVSGPNDDGTLPCSPLPANDWSCPDWDNRTDGTDFTWGPFPPYQISAEACLNGTKIDWALPADGSNLTGEPNVGNWGYVVSWGTENDPDLLADWSNPNRTPLPGESGYLASPPGGEPTSYVITGWTGNSINATVTTALSYTDPDAADTLSYRSAAFFRVVEDPAKLDPVVFQVGDAVDPFVSKAGSDLQLDWPAVAGASGYAIQVWDLATKSMIPCPPGLDCAPGGNSTLFSGGITSSTDYGFRVFAVDACGDLSAN